ncbi:MAG: diacylglycerol kinase family lipid kinase [Clostridiales bacterium]|nr:diacylglycerol kinase family lipid kinase [Clostridiales bacterium]
MKNIFIINPAAGSKDSSDAIEKEILKVSDRYNCEIYRTKYAGDATRYVSEYCKSHSEPLRFFSCGGDGTLNEVANGIAGFENATFGCYPCGSGNDFVKYYGSVESFLDIENLLEGTEQLIDLIRVGDKYCVNICNFGFDAVAAKNMSKLKYNKLLGGSRAYYAGTAKALFGSMKTPCRIEADGEILTDDDILLCTVANGKYIGGSFLCAPRAKNDDGYLDLCLVNPISRFSFIKLVGSYKNGLHLDDKRFSSFIVYRRCKKLSIKGGKNFIYALDGEIYELPNMEIEVVPKAAKFIVPQGLSC